MLLSENMISFIIRPIAFLLNVTLVKTAPTKGLGRY